MKRFYDVVMQSLHNCVEQNGGNVAQTARTLDVDNRVFHPWITGKRSPTLQAVGPIMDKIGVQAVPPTEEAVDYEYIPFVDAVAGAGSSYQTSADVRGYLAFRRDYCMRRHIHANTCITLTISGDSMSPLLQSGDTILVDTTEKDVRSGSIYFIGLGEECLVKQLVRMPNGISVRSINTVYPEILVPSEQIGSYLYVHGRVKWYGRDLD